MFPKHGSTETDLNREPHEQESAAPVIEPLDDEIRMDADFEIRLSE